MSEETEKTTDDQEALDPAEEPLEEHEEIVVVAPEEGAPAPAREVSWRDYIPGALAFFVPFLIYLPWVREQFTFWDSSELLTTAVTLGVPHPSGYPLFTILGHLASKLPFPTYNLAVVIMVSTIPSACTSLLTYGSLRRFRVGVLWALAGALFYAFLPEVVYHSTKVEVYPLHVFLLGCSVYALVRWSEDRTDLRWAYAATLANCLGLTNHLTTAMMTPAVMVALLIMGGRRLFKPKPILILCGIALACASIYLYLPWRTMANHSGETITWNNPETWERFVHHVTGAEYDRYRKPGKIWVGIRKFLTRSSTLMSIGVWPLAVLGILEMFKRRWRLTLVFVLYIALMLTYIGYYQINDIQTYYPGLWVVIALFVTLGVRWLLVERAPSHPRWAKVYWGVALLSGVACIGGVIWVHRAEWYREAVLHDMSEQIADDMNPGDVVFTYADNHSFSMWYQNYVNHPDRSLVSIDLATKGQKWYREHLPQRFPYIKWPEDDKVFNSSGFVSWLMRNNPDRTFYAIVAKPWKNPGTVTQIRGWQHEVFLTGKGQPSVQATKFARHMYMAKHKKIAGNHYFWDSDRTFEQGTKGLACTIEWFDDHEAIKPQWFFYGPDGVTHEVAEHPVPSNSNLSWDFLPKDKQVVGPWRCVVKLEGETPLVYEFEIVPKGELDE